MCVGPVMCGWSLWSIWRVGGFNVWGWTHRCLMNTRWPAWHILTWLQIGWFNVISFGSKGASPLCWMFNLFQNISPYFQTKAHQQVPEICTSLYITNQLLCRFVNNMKDIDQLSSLGIVTFGPLSIHLTSYEATLIQILHPPNSTTLQTRTSCISLIFPKTAL